MLKEPTNSQGGAIAFVDGLTAWVTGPTAQSNREGIEAIINEALDWGRRSRATFEAEKTAIIHFTPKAYKSDQEPFTNRINPFSLSYLHFALVSTTAFI